MGRLCGCGYKQKTFPMMGTFNANQLKTQTRKGLMIIEFQS